MARLTDHLIVISFDCLSSLDFPLLQTLPHFQTLLKNGVYARKVETIYPSVTYPCHATIVTGKFPNRHGIVNNTLLQPGKPSPDWHWYRRDVQGTTLYDEAKRADMKTAALLWPVTAKANIDYNMPEIFANRPWHNQIFVSLLNGSPFYQLHMNWLFGHLRKGLSQPELDDFVLASTVHTIKTKKPNLLLVHFTDLDTKRHYYGFSSREAIAAVHRHNDRLGSIMEALQEAGIYEQSTIVVLGDHSALDESKAIQLNVLLREQGLITVNKRGRVMNWKAYCKSCDGSAYIYVNDQDDVETITTVKRILQHLLQDPHNGIESVITGRKAGTLGADPTCTFMLEAQKGYYFREQLHGSFLETVTADEAAAGRGTIATHGYSPEKENYTTIFMAAGKGVRHNIVVPSMRLIDEGPTLARLLGLDLGDTDGRMMEELLMV